MEFVNKQHSASFVRFVSFVLMMNNDCASKQVPTTTTQVEYCLALIDLFRRLIPTKWQKPSPARVSFALKVYCSLRLVIDLLGPAVHTYLELFEV